MDNIELMRYCYDNFDVNHDGKVSFVEAKAVSEFHCRFIERSYGVDGVSLKGIEYFSGIKDLDIAVKASSIKGTLDCSMFKDLRQLSIDVEAPLSVRFEKNGDLEHVSIECQSFDSSVHVSNMDKLKTFMLRSHEDEGSISVKLSSNPNLEDIELYPPQIMSLEIDRCTAISTFGLSAKNIREISLAESSFSKNIEIIDYAELSTLAMRTCVVPRITIRNCHKLQNFSPSNIKAETVIINNCELITSLTSITQSVFDAREISIHNIGVRSLNVSGPSLYGLVVKYCNDLKQLDISDSRGLFHVGFEGNIERLSFDQCHYAFVGLSELLKLKYARVCFEGSDDRAGDDKYHVSVDSSLEPAYHNGSLVLDISGNYKLHFSVNNVIYDY